MQVPRAFSVVLLVAAILMCLPSESSALRAHFQRADIPEGGFSKRKREEAASRRGKKHKERYEEEDHPSAYQRSSGTSYDSYVRNRLKKSGKLSWAVPAVLLVAAAAFLWRDGTLQRLFDAARRRAGGGGRLGTKGRASRTAPGPSQNTGVEPGLRASRIQRFAAASADDIVRDHRAS